MSFRVAAPTPIREPQAFTLDEIGTHREVRRKHLALPVEEHRVFAEHPGEGPFGESGHRHHVEGEPARGLDGPHPDAAVAATPGAGYHLGEPPGEALPHLVEGDFADVPHRIRFRQAVDDSLGMEQGGAGQSFEVARPLGIGGVRGGEGRQPAEDGQGGLRESVEVAPTQPKVLPPRVVRFRLFVLPQSLREVSEPPFPAVETPDDLGIQDEPLPAARRHESPSLRSIRRPPASVSGPSVGAAGVSPSERYSANRVAESPSRAQSRRTTKARPAGCGRRAPASKNAGIPARAKAS